MNGKIRKRPPESSEDRWESREKEIIGTVAGRRNIKSLVLKCEKSLSSIHRPEDEVLASILSSITY